MSAIQPYLFFDGRCLEAIEFYKQALDANVEMLMRFKDSPEPLRPGTPPENVMHAALRIGDAQVLASDGESRGGKPSFKGFAISLTAKDDPQAKRFFGALSQGGSVMQPLIETFFASSFGMVADRFGVAWIVMAQKAQKAQKAG